MLLLRWIGYPLVLGAKCSVLVERQCHQLILVYVISIVLLILLVLDVTHKIFLSWRKISIEQVWHHVVTPLTSCGERFIFDLGVFIEFLNVIVYRGNVGIYNGQVLPHVGGWGPGVLADLWSSIFKRIDPQGLLPMWYLVLSEIFFSVPDVVSVLFRQW